MSVLAVGVMSAVGVGAEVIAGQANESVAGKMSVNTDIEAKNCGGLLQPRCPRTTTGPAVAGVRG